ncbi:MAG: beta-hydroxyacyl-ACP dehydratase [Kiritimatiellae bacterium]|nr:beta-hydroxyacyl-ACP dehydratase [Kiritimatiellia bacterium]
MEIPKFSHECGNPGVELLPHRPPFLFVDRLITADETGCVGEFTYRPEDFEYLTPASGGTAAVPGMILIETMSQVAGAGMVSQGFVGGKDKEAVFAFAAVDRARFRRPVRLGDTLVTVVRNEKVRRPLGVFSLKGYVNGELVAEALVKCMLSERAKAREA